MSGLNKYQTFDENFSLAGKTAIITGTCGGIGIQIAKMFARKGANIAAVDQGGEKMQAAWEELETYVKEQGREFLALPGDLTDTEFVDVTIAEKTMEAFGKIDVLPQTGVITAESAALLDHAYESPHSLSRIDRKGILFRAGTGDIDGAARRIHRAAFSRSVFSILS